MGVVQEHRFNQALIIALVHLGAQIIQFFGELQGRCRVSPVQPGFHAAQAVD